MAPKYKDYYSLLGVSKSADAKEISTAYRRLAGKFHPDVNPNDKTAEDKFKEIGEAYDVLKDETKRTAYDTYGDQWRAATQGQSMGRSSRSPGGHTFDFSQSFAGTSNQRKRYDVGDPLAGSSNLNDLFSTLFGQMGESGTGGRRPEDASRRSTVSQTIETNVSLTIMEAVEGCSKQLIVNQKDGLITFNIPAGIKDGSKLRLAATTKRKEILATMHITVPSGYERREDNLVLDTPVLFTTCILGGDITVLTADGERKTLRLPPGTEAGQQLRLARHGMPRGAAKPRGDLIVRIKLFLPKTLSDEQLELVKDLANSLREPS